MGWFLLRVKYVVFLSCFFCVVGESFPWERMGMCGGESGYMGESGVGRSLAQALWGVCFG